MQKSRDAFRTISEVADWLDVPTHVLRFWESRFSQIKPVKRAGGRRYYRPSDMRVIGGVKTLLHDQGMTIRGVQKLFREEGIKHVSSFSAPLHGETGEEITQDNAGAVIDGEAAPATPAPAARTSRDAQPDPIIDETAQPEEEPSEPSDDATIAEPAPVFSHQSAQRAGSKPIEPSVSEDDAAPSDKAEPALAELDLGPSSDTDTAAEVLDSPADAAEESEPAEPEIPARTIPETPDVPATDPADDAPEFARGPGVAARLRLVNPAVIDANRADLQDAARRLKAVLEQAH